VNGPCTVNICEFIFGFALVSTEILELTMGHKPSLDVFLCYVLAYPISSNSILRLPYSLDFLLGSSLLVGLKLIAQTCSKQ
jgi:hypothetical protein